jgi:hypothetical protein
MSNLPSRTTPLSNRLTRASQPHSAAEPPTPAYPSNQQLPGTQGPPGGPRGRPLGLPQIRTCPTKAYGSSSHGFATPLGYPRPLRGQGLEARCPRLVARPRPRDPAPPSLRRVLAGRVPRPRRYYEGLRLLLPPLAVLLCSPGDTRVASGHSLPPGPDAGPAGRESLGFGHSHKADLRRGRAAGLSGSWGTLVCVRPVLGPRQDRYARPTTAYRHGPSARSDGGLAARRLISGLDGTAFTLVVYASSVKSPRPTQDSLLAAGQALPGGIGDPQGSCERFPSCNRYISSPFPKLFRTQERPSSAAGGAGEP